MDIQLLLKDISAVSRKYEFIHQKTGANFNILDIVNIACDEVAICKIIYELINPRGSHCQGSLYLKLFFEHVLDLKFSESDYKELNVFREYVLTDCRRIDLLIENSNRSIPIEVKINAGDQEKQCYDYYRQKARNSKLFYLTLNGIKPSLASAEGLKPIYNDNKEIIAYEEVAQISFDNEIITWLNRCIEQQETIRIAPIREVLLQFLAVVRRLTNRMEEGKEMEIMENILSSSEYLKGAIEIEKALSMVKTKIMKDFFSEIKAQFEAKGKEIIDFDVKSIEEFYNSNVRTYPTISIKIKEITTNIIAVLRIGIDHNLYFSFNFMEYDNSKKSYVFRKLSCMQNAEYERFNNLVDNAMPFQGKKSSSSLFWEYIFLIMGKNMILKTFQKIVVNCLIIWKM